MSWRRRCAGALMRQSHGAHAGDWHCSCGVLQPVGWRSACLVRWRCGTASARSLCRAGNSARCWRRSRCGQARRSRPTGSSLDLWGERAPASATGSLQNTVWALRKLLGRDVLVTQAPGYRLVLPREAVDSHRFERLLKEAREAEPATKARLLGEGLELWRGPALADLDEEDFARREAARLEELRSTCAGGPDRRRAQARPARGARRRARAPGGDPPAARSPPRPADARALPLRPPGRSARGLSRLPARARRRARARPLSGAPGARAKDPAPGSRARRALRGHSGFADTGGLGAPARDRPRGDAAGS